MLKPSVMDYYVPQKQRDILDSIEEFQLQRVNVLEMPLPSYALVRPNQYSSSKATSKMTTTHHPSTIQQQQKQQVTSIISQEFTELQKETTPNVPHQGEPHQMLLKGSTSSTSSSLINNVSSKIAGSSIDGQSYSRQKPIDDDIIVLSSSLSSVGGQQKQVVEVGSNSKKKENMPRRYEPISPSMKAFLMKSNQGSCHESMSTSSVADSVGSSATIDVESSQASKKTDMQRQQQQEEERSSRRSLKGWLKFYTE